MHKDKVQFLEDNATAMAQPDGGVAANVIFFLLHELPDELKARALSESTVFDGPVAYFRVAQVSEGLAGELRSAFAESSRTNNYFVSALPAI